MRVRTAPAVLICTLVLASTLVAQQKVSFATLDDALKAGSSLGGRFGPASVNWIDGGKRFSFTVENESGQEEIRALDPGTARDTLLFSAEGLTFPDTTEPFSYDAFQWARDSRHLVFQTHFKPIYRRSGTSDYYVYALATRKLQLAARRARTAELSPDGSMLGFERDGDLFVDRLATRQERRLTTGATEKVHNGRFDWVYEEEFGMSQAWNWSPDSRYLAFWQIDERAEPVTQISDLSGVHPKWDRIPYPQVGDSNPKARIGVVRVATGRRVWLDTGEKGEFYIPRIYWTSRADTLAVMTLNRAQNTMKVFFFDVRTGGRRLVLTQRSDTWIDVYDFYAGIQDMISFPEGLAEFLWISDRDGWQHIYRYDYSGKLINQVTSGQWNVTRIEGTDPRTGTIYFSSTEVSPLQRQLYSIRFDGSVRKRLTETPGTHNINMSPDTRLYIDTWSSVHRPRQVELWATAGPLIKRLEDNAGVSRWLESHAYSPAEIFSFTTSDSVHLDGSMIRPPDFDSTRRYPVVFAIYGGPGSQQVYDAFSTSTYSQYLAQQGYIVVGLNNRGSNNYGSGFMKLVYHHLGKWESRDFAEAAKYLATLPYVDRDRIAITGTSYGGYATLYTMAMYPDLFSVGIANSPVTDWRYYDTIYTERYMDLLSANLAGYEESAVLTHAKKIKGRLLLIHSLLDDNVHPQNTMQLLTALTEAGTDAELRIYPPGHHGAAYDFQSARLIAKASADFLNRTLQGGAPRAASTR